MGARELAEWIEFYNLEPFGPWALNFNFARLMLLLYNVNRTKNMPLMELRDWMIGDTGEGEKKPMDIGSMEKLLKGIAKPGKPGRKLRFKKEK